MDPSIKCTCSKLYKIRRHQTKHNPRTNRVNPYRSSPSSSSSYEYTSHHSQFLSLLRHPKKSLCFRLSLSHTRPRPAFRPISFSLSPLPQVLDL
nr:hypothetical protein Iba_chr05eCG11590 [Ipomoea batatas]